MSSGVGDVESGADHEYDEDKDQRLGFSGRLDSTQTNGNDNASTISISGAAKDDASSTDEPHNKLRREFSNALFNSNLKGFNHQQKEYGTWETIMMAYQSLGVVFGDLGTSPLYVYPTIQFVNSPTETDFLGVLSIIFWTMTLVAVVKYVFIVMAADDHGEGGTFAVYSVLCKYANVGPNAGLQSVHTKSEMQLSNSSKHVNLNRRNRSTVTEFLESSTKAQRILLVVVVIGSCMIFGDGVLTPAISVLSAITGIKSEFPAVGQTVVIIVTAVIILFLFGLQSFGTRRVSFMFSPIMALWSVTIFCIGVYNIVVYGPHVFKAISPHYIVLFFQNNHKSAWVALGGSILCITGAEAMFADLGHFNRRSIQMAFLTVIYPSCIIAYAGETAYIIKHPEQHANALFASVPRAIFWPVFILATLAAIVASQSLISASFSVVKQAMALGCFPRVKLVHTSSVREGQVYCPEINYVIMVLCLLVVFGFRDAIQIGNAFGVTVVFVMFLTTCLMGLVMLTIWETPWYVIVPFLAVYGSIEVVYLTSVLYKFPNGGWVPFAISVFFGVIMLSWTYGHRKKTEYELQDNLGMDGLASLLDNTKIQRVPGICFFYTNLAHGISPIIGHYVKSVRTLHQVIVFTTIRFIPVDTVLPSERFLVSRVGHKGVYRCVARYGYMESISIEGGDFKEKLLESLRDYLQTPASYQARFTKSPFIREDGSSEGNAADYQGVRSSSATDELEDLAAAEKEEVVYVLGNRRMSINKNAQWWKKVVLGNIYAFLRNNCRKTYDQLRIPPSNLLEVGMVYDVM